VLPKAALQGSIATLIYVLVTHSNNHCKVATHNGGLWQRLHVFLQTMGKWLLWQVATYRFSLLQHLHMLQGIIKPCTKIMPVQCNEQCKTIQHIVNKHTRPYSIKNLLHYNDYHAHNTWCNFCSHVQIPMVVKYKHKGIHLRMVAALLFPSFSSV
jgi:hypothetical protein